MSKIKQNILNFLLFPEYRLYKIALKAKNEHERDGLEIFAAAWVVLKIAIVLGVNPEFTNAVQNSLGHSCSPSDNRNYYAGNFNIDYVYKNS